MKTRICYRAAFSRGYRDWVVANPKGTAKTSMHRYSKAAIAHALAEMGGADQPHTIRRWPGGIIEVRVP